MTASHETNSLEEKTNFVQFCWSRNRNSQALNSCPCIKRIYLRCQIGWIIFVVKLVQSKFFLNFNCNRLPNTTGCDNPTAKPFTLRGCICIHWFQSIRSIFTFCICAFISASKRIKILRRRLCNLSAVHMMMSSGQSKSDRQPLKIHVHIIILHRSLIIVKKVFAHQ